MHEAVGSMVTTLVFASLSTVSICLWQRWLATLAMLRGACGSRGPVRWKAYAALDWMEHLKPRWVLKTSRCQQWLQELVNIIR